VIRVQVGDDYRIDVQQLVHRYRQPDQRIGEVAVGGARKARVGALLGEQRVDQEALPGVVDDEGGVADLLNVHEGSVVKVNQ
jgi:hypothetical protein